MKKILLLAFAMTIVASGAYAQKKATVKNKQVTTTAPVNNDGTQKSGTAKILDVRELPMPEMGLDLPLIEAMRLRATKRDILPEELPIELVSSLLWSAYGINRPEEGKRVVPSAINAQEFDIYLFNHEGIYLYNAEKNSLEMVSKGDQREAISEQSYFKEAPISLVMVANYDRMKRFKDQDVRDFYAAVDCGYISQNIYLFCASAKLATVACGGINHDKLKHILNLNNGRALLAHPVGIGK